MKMTAAEKADQRLPIIRHDPAAFADLKLDAIARVLDIFPGQPIADIALQMSHASGGDELFALRIALLKTSHGVMIGLIAEDDVTAFGLQLHLARHILHFLSAAAVRRIFSLRSSPSRYTFSMTPPPRHSSPS